MAIMTFTGSLWKKKNSDEYLTLTQPYEQIKDIFNVLPDKINFLYMSCFPTSSEKVENDNYSFTRNDETIPISAITFVADENTTESKLTYNKQKIFLSWDGTYLDVNKYKPNVILDDYTSLGICGSDVYINNRYYTTLQPGEVRTMSSSMTFFNKPFDCLLVYVYSPSNNTINYDSNFILDVNRYGYLRLYVKDGTIKTEKISPNM